MGPGLEGDSPPTRGVRALIAEGAGFIASGRVQTFAQRNRVSTNVARWDGAAWQPLASGLGTLSYVGVDALALRSRRRHTTNALRMHW